MISRGRTPRMLALAAVVVLAVMGASSGFSAQPRAVTTRWAYVYIHPTLGGDSAGLNVVMSGHLRPGVLTRVPGDDDGVVSPDGQTVAFARAGAKPGLYVVP